MGQRTKVEFDKSTARSNAKGWRASKWYIITSGPFKGHGSTLSEAKKDLIHQQKCPLCNSWSRKDH